MTTVVSPPPGPCIRTVLGIFFQTNGQPGSYVFAGQPRTYLDDCPTCARIESIVDRDGSNKNVQRRRSLRRTPLPVRSRRNRRLSKGSASQHGPHRTRQVPRVVDGGELARRVHRQQRGARRRPCGCRAAWPRAGRSSIRTGSRCSRRTPGTAPPPRARPGPQRGARRVGRVALVRVDLEDRAAAGHRLVRRVVPLGIVRVHGVAGVGRHAPGRGERLPLLGGRGAEGREMRTSTSSSKGPLAPERDSEPSSSWSKAASTLMWPASRRARASSARARRAPSVRLSMRPDAKSASSRPNRAGAAVSAMSTS